MSLGDGIRRNIAYVDSTERDLLRDAILTMHQMLYPGNTSDTPPGGVSWWFKQDEIHQSTHVHGGPEFLPWHREITNRFERLLRYINPQLSLHYWDFREDPRNIPNGNIGGGMIGKVNLFDANFMGSSSGSAGDPWLKAGFYDPQAGQKGHPPNRDVTDKPFDSPPDIPRTRKPEKPGDPPAPLYPIANLKIVGNPFEADECPDMPINDDADITSAKDFHEFRLRLECTHDLAHVYFADVDPHNAFRDPFVFLLHSNVDRIYAQWQNADPTRLDPAKVYGEESDKVVLVKDLEGNTQPQNLSNLVEPWSTGIQVTEKRPIRPWYKDYENQGVLHHYNHISVVAPPRYDTTPAPAKTSMVVYILTGAGGVQIEYAITSGTPFYLYYTNPAGTYTFREGDIRIQENPDLGSLVTVDLPFGPPWLKSTTFTLVVPSLRPLPYWLASEPVNIIGIETTTFFSKKPSFSQSQHYRETSLQGWAYFT